jgi:transcriptional regulator with XRE-family HTH domain
VPENSVQTAIVEQMARTLTARRIEKGLSMNELSQKAGIGLTTVSYIERGIRSPSLDSLLRIANVLDVELWQLIREATAKAVHSRKPKNHPVQDSTKNGAA